MSIALVLALAPALASAAAEAPTISAAKAVAITDTTVRLEAMIGPNGKKTQYRFEYLSDVAYQANPEGERFAGAIQAPGATEIPVEKEGKPVVAETVAVEISGLSPNTSYYFRPLASNSKGKTTGPESQFLTFRPPHVFDPCPNDALRLDRPSAPLSDCRAYEQTTPVAKTGDIVGSVFTAKASLNGDAVSFQSIASLPFGEGAQTVAPIYLASRHGGGWSTQGLLPPESSGPEANVKGWTQDFAQVFDAAKKFSKPTTLTFLARSSADGSLRAIVPHTPALEREPNFAGASADGNEIFFEARESALVPGAAAGKDNLYVWDRETETVRLAGALNGGPEGQAPPAGAFAGPYDWVAGTSSTTLSSGGAVDENYVQDMHAVANDGSGVYFTAAKTGQIYLRKNPAEAQSPLNGEGKCADSALACTVHVSGSQRSVPDTVGAAPAAFMGATPDGAHAYFTSSEKLTDGAHTGPEQPAPTIGRVNVTNGSAEDLSFLPQAAAGVTVFGEHIYWANPKAGTIGRAKLNGSGAVSAVEPDFIDEEVGTPQYVAVDSEHIYWTNSGELGEYGPLPGHGMIGRADINGKSSKPNFIEGAGDPQGIAVSEGEIYWTNSLQGYCVGGSTGCISSQSGIGRAPTSGANPEQDFISRNGSSCVPKALAIDAFHIYWSLTCAFQAEQDLFNDYLERADLNGQNQISRFISECCTANENGHVRGVALDAGHVYWASQRTGDVGRADLDLTKASVEKEFAEAGGTPKGLAVDGEHIYFSANGEPHPNPGNDLYRFDAASGNLTDLVPDPGDDPNGAEVQGVLGASTDGSYLYFVANAILAAGATPGDCSGSPESSGGECNLYLDHEGQVSFIARLDSVGDTTNWRQRSRNGANLPMPHTARVSPDGRTLLFRSRVQLTAYDNEGVPELYRYRVGDPEPLLCVSCSPIGASPVGAPMLEDVKTPAVVSVFQPAPTLSRNLSASGDRVFFQTPDALVGADINGNGAEANPCPEVNDTAPRCQDVYEWEANGSGSCHSALENGGCLYLLSSGSDSTPSFLIDASANGEDAFILTGSRLVGQDEDDLQDIYDVRVNGGLASQSPQPVPICEGEACKGGAATPPEGQSPGTASFSGPANAKPHHKKSKARKKKRHHRHVKKTHHNRREVKR